MSLRVASGARPSAPWRAALLATACAALCLTFAPRAAWAVKAEMVDGHLSKWPIDPKDPSSSVPPQEALDREPLQAGYFLMDLGFEADKSAKAKDYRGAIKYYQAMEKMVPDRAVSFAKECECHQLLGERELAVQSCKTAVNREGVRVADAARYITVLTGAPEGPTAAEMTEVNAVLKHLRDEKIDAVTIAQIECELAIQLDDEPRLQACTAVLEAKAPHDQKSVSFLWALAVKQGDYRTAKQMLGRAKEAGMPQAALEKMLEGTRSIRWAWLSNGWRLGIGGLLLGALAAAAMFFGRRARSAGHGRLEPSSSS